ncbi:hypothetical protein [Citrobacter sp. Cb220]|uniref:hypothetical protein n=1 Tax=Citrobacter sp. Cb220 TaxID=2985034 RepID=UPI00257898EA|nr:hypothetical protein [Citrobacter sp. Cb220]MDM3316395.1 hypothetical protein [Citrobacter sp. Cb220]
MPMESADFEEVLQEALTERDMQLQEKELPEINIGEALPVKEGLDFSRDYVDFGVSEVVGSVKDGIIGNKTNSLKTIDSDIEWLKAPVGQWAKAAIYSFFTSYGCNKINASQFSARSTSWRSSDKNFIAQPTVGTYIAFGRI